MRPTGRGHAHDLGAVHAVIWISALVGIAMGHASAQELTRAPELVEFVEAEYPADERAAGREATVTIEITIDATGAVSDARVVGSAGAAFDEAALAAVRRFRFTPAEVDGAPSAIRIEYGYRFAPAEEVPRTAALAGTIRDRRTRAPLSAVTVRAGERSATTDAAGRFEISELAPGAVVIRLEGERLTPLETSETLVAGERLEVIYDVTLREEAAPPGEEDDLEIVVTAPALRREVVSTEVSADDARRIPGASGDVLRVVESLPGVARSSVGSADLVVWGASPEDTRVYLDGVRIPRLYHEGGFRSVVASDLVDSVELVPGGYGAALGRGLGGVVLARSTIPEGDGLHGSIAADVFDVGATLRASLEDRWRAAASARVSWLDLLADATGEDLGEYVPIPRYWDAQVRALHAPRVGETVEAALVMGSDRVSRGVPSSDPALGIGDERALDFGRLYARWEHERDDRSKTTVVPWLGYDRVRRESRFGATRTAIASESFLGGLRFGHRESMAEFLSLELGLDAEIAFVSLERNGSIGLPAREGDLRVFGQPPPDAIASDAWEVVPVSIAPYVEADFTIAETVHLAPGVRLDPYARSVSRRAPAEGENPDIGLLAEDFAIEPRLRASWAPTDSFELRAAAGLYHQEPAPEDLSAAFGNPTLGIARAWHALAGVTVKPIEQLSIEATGFATFSDELATRSPLESPRRAEALVQDGSGRAFGAQVLVRLDEIEGFSGWIAYTLSRAERRDREDAAWRLFDFDQTHVLTALLSWKSEFGLSLGARFRFATGMPRTPVTGAYYDAGRDRWQPVFGDGAERLSEFVQVDLRVAQEFELSTTKLEISLDVQNATNAENAEELVYAPDYSRRDIIAGLPILPVLGVRWTF
jgi:TonB family protein